MVSLCDRECVHHLQSLSLSLFFSLPLLFPLFSPSLYPASSSSSVPSFATFAGSLPVSSPSLSLACRQRRACPSSSSPILSARALCLYSTAVRGTIVDLFLVCARQCLVAPLIEFACRQHGGRCGGATIVVSKREECYATTAAPSCCPERRRVYQLLSSAATPSQLPSPPLPCPSFPSFPPPPSPSLPCSLLPPFPPLLPPSLATTATTTTTIAVAAATAIATATSQSAGFLAFVRTGDHRVAVEPTGKKKCIQHFTILSPLLSRYQIRNASYFLLHLPSFSSLSSSLLQASCYRSRPLRIVMEMFMLVMRELLPFLSLRERDATLTFYELFL